MVSKLLSSSILAQRQRQALARPGIHPPPAVRTARRAFDAFVSSESEEVGSRAAPAGSAGLGLAVIGDLPTFAGGAASLSALASSKSVVRLSSDALDALRLLLGGFDLGRLPLVGPLPRVVPSAATYGNGGGRHESNSFASSTGRRAEGSVQSIGAGAVSDSAGLACACTCRRRIVSPAARSSEAACAADAALCVACPAAVS